MRHRGRQGLAAAACVAAAVGVAFASTSGADTNRVYAVAGALPPHYRLTRSERLPHGLDRTAYNRKQLHDDEPLQIDNVRPGNPDFDRPPRPETGDESTTVRGHPATLSPVSDEGTVFAHELEWKERPDLKVVVQADDSLGTRWLRTVAENIRVVGKKEWTRLYTMTSAKGQIGHPSKSMRRVPVIRRTLNARPYTLTALIPPHYPLGPEDRRVSCVQLAYNGARRYGFNCGGGATYARVGGRLFAFGAFDAHARRLRIASFPHTPKVDVTTKTASAHTGPAVRYFAAPLPNYACSILVAEYGKNAERYGDPTGPLDGPDYRRCNGRDPP
jgi:hypothetical protein